MPQNEKFEWWIFVDDETDDASQWEDVWEDLCGTAARSTGLPISKVKALLDDAGFHMFGHCGLVDVVETVGWLASQVKC